MENNELPALAALVECPDCVYDADEGYFDYCAEHALRVSRFWEQLSEIQRRMQPLFIDGCLELGLGPKSGMPAASEFVKC